ncbi:hypothetical protein ACIQNV_37265 [Streptomyces hydrogenans]|uniref:hypothetical protein n=1 Tax=Streptomyces hydrogenans TaxID=1873719 RepID=UPI003801E1DE
MTEAGCVGGVGAVVGAGGAIVGGTAMDGPFSMISKKTVTTVRPTTMAAPSF